ncbi:MAG: PKD domain-containing protein, partial [Bacteroidota bacterium]
MRSFLIALLIFHSAGMFANVHAEFSADKFSGCSPLVVTFSNNSQPSDANWSWDFGNGNTSTLANPSAVFNVSGVYQVKLVASYGGQKDSISKTITVFRLPQVDFHAAQTNVCQKDTLRLINDVVPGDAAITNYGWGFGNGIASNVSDPWHVYNTTGSYNITLVVQDANGCSANSNKNGYIQVLAKPVIAFTASPASSCNASQLVSFTNTSSGSGLTYLWNLDNGVTATTSNATHTYSQEKRTVTLIGTSPNGCASTASQQISVGQVIAEFTSKTEACTGEQIQFTNLSNVMGTAGWNFGDGTYSALLSPVKVYQNPGTYTVKLTQHDGACSNAITKTNYIVVKQGFSVTFDIDKTSGGCNDTSAVINFVNTTTSGTSFNWYFGDQTASTEQNPTHAFNSSGNYYVSLTVTDTVTGCVVKATQMTQVSLAPSNLSFRADTVSCPGGLVRFHNIFNWNLTYKWDFGDGKTSSGPNPTHSYAIPGIYTITMTATGGQGCSSTITKVNYIRIEEITTDFTVNETFSPCPPFVTVFSSTASRSDLTYKWDFGDGTSDVSANPTHIYFHPGIFTVKMITKSPNGCMDTVIYPNLIEVQGPTGTFSALPTSGCVPLTVSFQSTISSNVKSMWCDLGDGTLVMDSQQFQHTYISVNTFNPKFVLVDHVGCAVPYELAPIVTYDVPALDLNDTIVCQGASVSVSLSNESYTWSPSLYLSCDTCANVVIQPLATTAFAITATNDFGCSTSGVMTIQVDSLPVLNSISPITVCANSSVDLFACNAH